MKSICVIPLLLSLQLLNGCAFINKQSKPVQVETTNTSTPIQAVQSNPDWLDYTASFSDLSADMQKKDLAQVLQALSQNKADINLRTKAAIIYSIPASKLKDNAKAQTLLDDLLKEKTLEAKQKSLLNLLRDFIADSTKLASKIKDEQKRSDAVQQKLDAAQQRADALQQKLDELKEIEKNMIDRDQRKPR